MPEFERGRIDETCQYCPPAFEIFEKSSNFEDAIRQAILFGGDSDTIAAIVGTLAESYYGLPRWMEDRVLEEFLPKDMLRVIARFNNKYR